LLGINHFRIARVHLVRVEFELTTLVVIGTDCTGSCKSNHQTIAITTAPPGLYTVWLWTVHCILYVANRAFVFMYNAAVIFDTILCDKVCQWLVTARWFSLGTPVSSTNKTDCHNIAEVLLKVALSTINLDRINFPCSPLLYCCIYVASCYSVTFWEY
jgi:hypothetical protein